MFYYLPKNLALWVIALVSLVVAWPGVQAAFGVESTDGFPLSNYRMFSGKRPDPRTFTYVRAVGSEEQSRIVKSHVWGWGGMNQAMKQIRRVSGKKARALCKRTAQKLTKSKAYRPYDQVEVVRDQYQLRAYFAERNKQPVRRRVLARCPIERGGP